MRTVLIEQDVFHVTSNNVNSPEDLSEAEVFPLCLGAGVNFFESSNFAERWMKAKGQRKLFKVLITAPRNRILDLDIQSNSSGLKKTADRIGNSGTIFPTKQSFLNSCVDCFAAEKDAEIVVCALTNFQFVYETDHDYISMVKYTSSKQYCVKNRSFLRIRLKEEVI